MPAIASLTVKVCGCTEWIPRMSLRLLPLLQSSLDTLDDNESATINSNNDATVATSSTMDMDVKMTVVTHCADGASTYERAVRRNQLSLAATMHNAHERWKVHRDEWYDLVMYGTCSDGNNGANMCMLPKVLANIIYHYVYPRHA